jgi:hypothetical protein
MIEKIAGLIFLAATVALQGCATKLGVDQIQVTSSYVTNGGTGPRFESTPMTSIRQKDTHYVVTHVHWEPVTESAGVHTVTLNWYSEDKKLVATRAMDLKFDKTPYRFWYRFPAGSLAVGKYRVDTFIDAKLANSQQFEIVP